MKEHKHTDMRKIVQLHVLCVKTSHDSTKLSKKRLGPNSINASLGHTPHHYLLPIHPCFPYFDQFWKLVDGWIFHCLQHLPLHLETATHTKTCATHCFLSTLFPFPLKYIESVVKEYISHWPHTATHHSVIKELSQWSEPVRIQTQTDCSMTYKFTCIFVPTPYTIHVTQGPNPLRFTKINRCLCATEKYIAIYLTTETMHMPLYLPHSTPNKRSFNITIYHRFVTANVHTLKLWKYALKGNRALSNTEHCIRIKKFNYIHNISMYFTS